jgi:hypothetical protein
MEEKKIYEAELIVSPRFTSFCSKSGESKPGD